MLKRLAYACEMLVESVDIQKFGVSNLYSFFKIWNSSFQYV